MQSVMVFAGAGASKAIGPESYPTTVDFFASLPESVTQDALFTRLVAFLKGIGRENLDIELLLWALQQVRDSATHVGDLGHPLGYLLSENRINSVIQNSVDFRAMLSTSNSLATTCDRLRDAINERVYALYAQDPPRETLNAAWVPLLQGLVDTADSLDVFTTNYDIVLEQAIHTARLPIVTGRSQSVLNTLDQTWWLDGANLGSRLKLASAKGLLTKLHGSVDWSLEGDRIFVGDPTFKGSHSRHVILYPGFKGAPDSQLFQSFHSYFRQQVQGVDLLLVVGFAFRDEFVNEVIERTLPTRASVIVVDIARDLPHAPRPVADRMYHIKQGFDENAVRSVLERLSQAGGALQSRG